MKTTIALALLLLSCSGRGAEWPITTAEQDEILNRSTTYAEASPERQQQQREQLVEAFHANASFAAYNVYFRYLSNNYDPSKPEEVKRMILARAEQMAKDAARANAVEWMSQTYSSGAKRSAASLILEMWTMLDSFARSREWNRFMDADGDIEFRSMPFQSLVLHPYSESGPKALEQREAVDPYLLAEQNYGGETQVSYTDRLDPVGAVNTAAQSVLVPADTH